MGNMTGAACGAGHAYRSRAPDVTLGLYESSYCQGFSFKCCFHVCFHVCICLLFFAFGLAVLLTLLLFDLFIWFVTSVSSVFTSSHIIPEDHSIKVWSQLAKQFQKKRIFKHFSHRVLCWLMVGGVDRYSSERGPPKDIPSKFGSNWPSGFRRRDF